MAVPGIFTPPADSYSPFTTSDFTITAPGSHTITLAGTSTGDFKVSLVDKVTITHYLVTATSTVPDPTWDPAHPRFFSGTNCASTATALAITGHVTHVQLLVGGILVKEYDDTATTPLTTDPSVILSTGTNLTSTNLTVNFDSTHFADSTSIPIQMNVQDSGGAIDNYSYQIAANAYNKAYVLANSTFVFGSTAEENISTRATSMHIVPFGSTSDVKQTILGIIPIYTAFYIDTHGYPGLFGDCFAQPDSDDTFYLYADSHNDTTGSASITMAVQSKTINQPPFNFVDLDDCYTSGNSNPNDRNAPFGLDSTLATAFGVKTQNDCAILGWSTESDESARNVNWVNQVWQDLANGQTLSSAIADAKNIYPPQLDGVDNAAVVQYFGDGNMTCHNTVYNGALGSWFR